MLLKFLCCLTFTLTIAAAAPKSKKIALKLLDDDAVEYRDENNVNERISALYVKDGESGQLRFLGGGGSSSGNNNAALNQFITSKQDLLEQLRPTSSGSATGTGTGTGTSLTSGTGTTNGVSPIIVNLGGSSATTGQNSAINSAINASPVVDLLPQIIAGAVLNRRSPTNRRRGTNNRRRGGNRNRNRKRNRPGNGQVYVIRPNRG